jgi:D-cysteine desulfhydrase family pyridoxal phosphate-dependent enzyme
MIPAIEHMPRVRLGFYPTPITDAQHLSSVLGGPHIYIKREDLSGLAMGGNKCRKLEFIMGFAKEQGYDAVVSTASSQSNFCLQIAAAARKLGMKPSFVLLKGVHTETQGNLLLQNILDSEVEILEFSDMTQLGGPFVAEKLEAAAERLRSKGYKPLIVKHNLPEITAIVGTVGWVNAAEELIQQLADSDIKADYVILANGGGGTQAGLILGSKYLKADYKVVGISVLNKKEQAESATTAQANATAEYLGLNTLIDRGDVEVYDEYIGEGYGIPTKECMDAIRLVAQTEAIYLDPVYTGKAMAGLIDLIKKGRFKPTDSIIFIHTGGIPALFAYHEEIAR